MGGGGWPTLLDERYLSSNTFHMLLEWVLSVTLHNHLREIKYFIQSN